MERQALDYLPLPCYGMEYDPGLKKCINCEYSKGCSALLWNRVPLTRIKFNCTPEKLNVVTIDASVETPDTVNNAYRKAHQQVYGKWPEHDLGLKWKDVARNAENAKCSVLMFLTTLMAGHKATRPGSPFYTNIASAESSVDKLDMYRNACLKQSAAFDSVTLGLVMGENYTDNSIENKLLLSETIAGRYIVGYKIRSSGSAVQSLYRDSEFKLDPYWLAIEPSYHSTVMIPYLEAKKNGTAKVSEQVANHRHEVSRIRAELHGKPRLASTVFATRTSIIQKAIKSVLSRYMINPADLYMEDSVIADPFTVWAAIGYVIQHIDCVNFIETGKTKYL